MNQFCVILTRAGLDTSADCKNVEGDETSIFSITLFSGREKLS